MERDNPMNTCEWDSPAGLPQQSTSNTYVPTFAAWTTYVYSEMGITTEVLPTNSPYLNLSWDVMCNIINPGLVAIGSPIFMLACFYLASSNLINFAQDQPDQTFFSDLRKRWDINSFVSGVVSSSSDEGTSTGLLNPRAFANLTLADLQYLKDPFGRQYLAIAQRFGTLWGLS